METKTILIVDDDEINIKLLERLLMSENYRTASATSGDEALEIIPDVSPDLILLDVLMPGIDGFEVCRILKRDENTRAIPVVMVTALAAKENKIAAMRAGADDFLNKPLDPIELRVRVKSLLRIKSYHDDMMEKNREITEKNERLQELDSMKEGLIHMVIHDLNNPFMVISGNLELLLMDMDRKYFSGEQIRMVEQCVGCCGQIGQMIKGLLDIHKMEEGKLRPNKKTTDPVKLIDEVMERFSLEIEKKRIAILLKKPGNRLLAEMDPELIKRVVWNLLNNAIRCTSEGGRIVIDVVPPTVNENLCIRVKDNGIGLEPEHHRKVFDKFEQATLKRTGVKTGTSGLGLAFCKLATEAHGGKIWVESKGRNQGCTFSFTIPPGSNKEIL